MDTALYLSLREEMQRDAVHVERQLDDLRKAESFLLRRINTGQHSVSYQVVLNDLATDITRAESEHAELLHLSRFVTRRLINTYSDSPSSHQTAPPKAETKSHTEETITASPIAPEPSALGLDSAIAEPESENLAPRQKSADQIDPEEKPHASPPKRSNDPKPNGPVVSGNNRAVSAPSPAGNAVEFDDNGFPILASSSPKSSTASKALDPQTRSEPPTVEFGPDGFPLNRPPNNAEETITEPPKRKPPKKAK